jgi:hypothetical protein
MPQVRASTRHRAHFAEFGGGVRALHIPTSARVAIVPAIVFKRVLPQSRAKGRILSLCPGKDFQEGQYFAGPPRPSQDGNVSAKKGKVAQIYLEKNGNPPFALTGRAAFLS